MTSNPFRKKAPADHQGRPSLEGAFQTSPDAIRPPIPSTGDREDLWEVFDIPSGMSSPPTPQSRDPPPRPPSRNSTSSVLPQDPPEDPFNPATESFTSSDSDDAGVITLARGPSEPRHSRSTCVPNPGGGNASSKPGGQSLGSDAPMPAGQSPSISTPAVTGVGLTPPIAPDSSSTDTSSVSRQSLFEPIPEAVDAVLGDTPRTSNEIDGEDEDQRRAKDRASRPKPPPPRPRNRSGGKYSAPSPSLSDTPSVTPTRPASIHSSTSERSLPLAPPPPVPPAITSSPAPASPPSPVPPIISRKVPPSPPLSRRQSVQSHTNPRHPPTTPIGGNNGKMKPPPPPPIRRHRSTNSRSNSGDKTSASPLTISPTSPQSYPHPPPPPPPPSRRNRSSTMNSSESREEPPSPPQQKPLPPPDPLLGLAIPPGAESDILNDLEKLQREVDELRGKYEGRIITDTVST